MAERRRGCGMAERLSALVPHAPSRRRCAPTPATLAIVRSFPHRAACVIAPGVREGCERARAQGRNGGWVGGRVQRQGQVSLRLLVGLCRLGEMNRREECSRSEARCNASQHLAWRPVWPRRHSACRCQSHLRRCRPSCRLKRALFVARDLIVKIAFDRFYDYTTRLRERVAQKRFSGCNE